MNAMKKVMALLLILTLAISCLPLGAVTAFAAEIEDPQIPESNASIPEETEAVTEPQTEPPTEAEAPEETTDSTEATESATGPATEPSTGATEPIPEETAAEEEPVKETTEPTEPDKGPLMKSPGPADTKGGSSGSEVGGGGDGSGNAAGSGSSNMIAVGVTMQIVYYRYDECYNRYNSHGSVISTVKNGKAIPWNSSGKDKGETMTTVFDTYTITDNTFIVKARWDSYPYVYHFPTENLASDGCTFTWSGFTNYWFNYNNPGGSASTYPRIVRNEEGGSKAIEDFLAQIILGSDFGAWNKLDVAAGDSVATDTSLFAAVLKYLGASDLAVQNYLDSYYGKLSVSISR